MLPDAASTAEESYLVVLTNCHFTGSVKYFFQRGTFLNEGVTIEQLTLKEE